MNKKTSVKSEKLQLVFSVKSIKAYLRLVIICFATTLVAFPVRANGNNPETKEVQQNPVITASGTVKDSNGEPLLGVSVVEKGKPTNGIITDSNGKFSLNVNREAILEISCIGFAKQEVKAGSDLAIVMKEGNNLLNEVVVTALGIKREKRALSYAMTELKAEDIATVPTQNLGNSLYGKAAGVRIQQTGAGPMGGTKIQIRGVNSLQATSRPLIVLDGVPVYDNDSGWSGRERNQTQPGSALNDINPEDIESMSFLKGANAAALYGSRASNGVILITTKSGKKMPGMGIEVNSAVTFDKVAYLPEYQNEFGGGTKDYFDVDPATGKEKWDWTTYNSFGPRLNGQNVLWWDGQVRPWVAQPNNYRDIFRNGYSNNNSFALSSGNEKTSMRLSYANYNYQGFLNNMKQNKNQFTLSATSELNKYLTVDASVMYSNINDQNTPTRTDRIANFPIPRNEISQLYFDNYKTPDGYYAPGITGTPINSINSALRDNIINYLIWQQNENRYTKNRNRVSGNIAATLKIIEPLTLHVKGGTDLIYDLKQNKEMWQKFSFPNDLNNLQGGYLKENWSYSQRFFDAMLSFNKMFADKLNVSVSVGTSAELSNYNDLIFNANGLIVNGMFSTNNNKQTNNQGRDTGYSQAEMLQSVYAMAQLAYKGYLYLDLTGRNDWSSRLPSNSRSFFYPSAGLSFIFSDAFRNRLPQALTYGKLRASYAIVGISAPSIYFTNYTYSRSNFDNIYPTQSFSATVPPTGGVKPEKTYSYEFGADLRFINNRVGLDVAYYSNETRNQILSIDIPSSTGATKLNGNAGTMANHGWEFALNFTPVQTKDFKWDATINFSYIKNKLVSFVNGLSTYVIGSSFNVQFVAQPGKSAYAMMLYPFKRDANGNKLVDNNGYYIRENTTSYYGDAMPTKIGGFNTSLTYKGFSLYASIDGQLDGKMSSFTSVFLKSSGAGKASLFGRDLATGGVTYWIDASAGNMKKRLDDNATVAPDGSRVYHNGIIAEGVKQSDGKPNDIILTAYDYYSTRYGQLNATEDYVSNNAYIKLRELTLNYSVPPKIYKMLKIQGLNLSLIADNLCYLYKQLPDNINPESSLGTGGVSPYMEYTAYPSMRSFGFAVKFKF